MAAIDCLLQCSPSIAKSTIKRAILELGWQIDEDSSNVITILTPTTIFSRGEDVKVCISSQDNNAHVSITSTPNSQLFDWGKSEENIRSLHDKILELL